MKRLVLLALLAGCPGLRHHSPQNAMGVTDLDTPFRGERGDPAAYEPPQDPGENQLGIAPGLFFGVGSGRTADSSGAALAVGGQVHLAFGERYGTFNESAGMRKCLRIRRDCCNGRSQDSVAW